MSIEGLIGSILQIYIYMIIAYVLLSWVPNARDSFIGELLGKVVDPYLSIFRKIIPPIGGMIDISPIIAIIALQFAASGLASVIAFILGG
ncbi:YggT family protein [Chengkuizengella marina]|uniref:YggT family protein n=1 Tax=Chengkuizengella marina TaxID=2507566 RepID=A0A6N9Q3N3_9BACL|nr:YggT family protein [Chengkuizengella marina]NBI29435.1 YggT family protein [Chengkuizengella marina]